MNNSNLINLLNIDLDKYKMITIAGPCASGKSTVITAITCEGIINGKKVLYFTEDRGNIVFKRINQSINGDFDEDQVDVLTGFYHNLTDFFGVMKQYDLIVVDTQLDIDFHLMRDFCFKNNCTMLFSRQIVTDLGRDEQVIRYDYSNKITQASDYIITLNRIVKKNSFLDKVINFICFWRKPVNTNIRVLKNRYGKQFNVDVNIEY